MTGLSFTWRRGLQQIKALGKKKKKLKSIAINQHNKRRSRSRGGAFFRSIIWHLRAELLILSPAPAARQPSRRRSERLANQDGRPGRRTRLRLYLSKVITSWSQSETLAGKWVPSVIPESAPKVAASGEREEFPRRQWELFQGWRRPAGASYLSLTEAR